MIIRRVYLMRGKKGEANKIFYKRVKKYEMKYIIQLKDNSIERDIIIILSPSKRILIKIKKKLKTKDKLIIKKNLEIKVKLLEEEAGTGYKRYFKSIEFKEQFLVSRNSSHVKRLSLKSLKLISIIKIKKKDVQSKKINLISATLQTINALLLNKDK